MIKILLLMLSFLSNPFCVKSDYFNIECDNETIVNRNFNCNLSFYNFKYAKVDINFENLKTIQTEITKSEEEYVSLGYYGGYGRYIIYSSEFKASTTLIGLEIETSAETLLDLVVHKEIWQINSAFESCCLDFKIIFVAFTCNLNGVLNCYNYLKSNPNYILVLQSNTPWVTSISLKKGYNFLNNSQMGSRASFNVGELLVIRENDKIKKYKINSSSEINDYACKKDLTLSIYTCSLSPTNFTFAANLIFGNEKKFTYSNRTVSFSANYSECGTYNINATTRFYSRNNVTIVNKNQAINVRYQENSFDICPTTTTSTTCTTTTDSTSTSTIDIAMSTTETSSSRSTSISSTTTTISTTTTSLIIFSTFTSNQNSLSNVFANTNTSSTLILNVLVSNYDMNNCLQNCSNNGYCRFNNLNQIFECKCNQYFTGSSCSLDLRACSSSQCLNNSTCIDYSFDSNLTQNQYYCKCINNYFGAKCENKIDLCTNKTCSNNGACIDLNNKAKCKCFKDYSGDECELKSNELKTIKNVISVTSIIAIIIICLFFLFVIISDIMTIFQNRIKLNSIKRKKAKSRVIHYKYIS